MQQILPRLALACGASIGLAGLGVAQSAAPVAAAYATPTTAQGRITPDTSSASPILLYAQDWNGAANGRTTAQWQQVAQTHAVLVGSTGAQYGNMIPQLHAWNPSLKVLVYDLGPYTIKGSAEYNTLMAEHPTYFAHDASGHLITMKAASGSPAFPNNYLMDEGNAGWQAWEASRVLGNINQYGYDGAYLDSMAPGPTSGGDTGLPIDPTTGHAYTATSWMQAEGHAMSVIKAAIGSKFLFSTGLVNGPEYTSYTHYLTDSTANGAQTDSWVRLSGSSPTQYPSSATLASDLAMVQSINAEGKSFFGWTKVWTTATAAQESAWNTYALAAYLLVDNGTTDYYSFSAPNLNADRTAIYYPNELAALGPATGAFTLSGGVYSRSFANGVVTLNTNSNAASITWAVKPGVSAVTPAAGPVAGGQSVTVLGSGFASGMTVTLGGSPVTPSNITFSSFTFATPPGSAGYAQVQVTTGLGASALTSNAGYVYAPLGNYVPLTPFRILDTRSASCVQCSGGALGGGAVRTVPITGATLPSGTDPIPRTATAVVLNVTAVGGTGSSVLTVYPYGTGRPNASNINFRPGMTTPNLVTAVLGDLDDVNIYNAVGTVNVIADVEGYFDPASSGDVNGEFHPIAPVRVCDTRSTGAAGTCRSHGLLRGGAPMRLDVTGAGSDAVPGTGAEAAVLNLTGIAGSAGTFLSVYPTTSTGTCATPRVSTLNLVAGQVQANRVLVALGPASLGGADTSVCVYNAVGTINVVVDANGWFGDGTASAGDQYQPIGPSRICDTRAGSGEPCAGHPVGAGRVMGVQVTSEGGVPANGASNPPLAVIANLTAIAPSAPTYITVYPADLLSTPRVSDINVSGGAVLADLAVVELSTATGAVDLFSAASTVNVVVDIEGWFQ